MSSGHGIELKAIYKSTKVEITNELWPPFEDPKPEVSTKVEITNELWPRPQNAQYQPIYKSRNY